MRTTRHFTSSNVVRSCGHCVVEIGTGHAERDVEHCTSHCSPTETYLRLLPPGYGIMLAPRVRKFPFPDSAPDLDAPPRRYKRPQISKHVGFITYGYDTKARAAGKDMGKMKKYQEEMGNPLNIRPKAADNGYDTVDATTNFQVKTTTSFT